MKYLKNTLVVLIVASCMLNLPLSLTVSAQSSDKAIYTPSSVKTPKGSIVPTGYMTKDMSLNRRILLEQIVMTQYPKAKKAGNATGAYNCHSYAWYSQDTVNNRHWINDPSKYMSDGSYSYFGMFNTVMQQLAISNRLYYPAGNHSARVKNTLTTTSPVILISKWGDGGLYEHAANESPYGSSNQIRVYR